MNAFHNKFVMRVGGLGDNVRCLNLSSITYNNHTFLAAMVQILEFKNEIYLATIMSCCYL